MNKQLAKVIDTMAKIDQNVRFLAIKNKTTKLNIYNFHIYSIDLGHNYKIHQLIKRYGFPTSKIIGKKSLKNFWLLIQHQDMDANLQEECLKHCDFNLENKAYLTDRIMVNRANTQIYGTQFNVSIVDKKNVDKRRREMGLEPLKNYLKKINTHNKIIKERTTKNNKI